MEDAVKWFFGIGTIIVIILCCIVGGCYIQPQYNVWQQEKEGQAEYAKAESSRKIKVLEAQATMDSAKMLADAEIARAKGVAEANRIIGESLKGNSEYLHYLWIHNLAETKSEVIYVPTEAGLPILEAGHRPPVKAEK